MPIYLMQHEADGQKKERLIEASSLQGARNHIAKDSITGAIAKPADLFRLAKANVELESAGEAPAQAEPETE